MTMRYINPRFIIIIIIIINIIIIIIIITYQNLNIFLIRGPALSTINPLTKFRLSTSTHYKYMKGDTKYQTWGGLWLLWVT